MTPDLSYYWEGAREECGDNKPDAKKELILCQAYIIGPVLGVLY